MLGAGRWTATIGVLIVQTVADPSQHLSDPFWRVLGEGGPGVVPGRPLSLIHI